MPRASFRLRLISRLHAVAYRVSRGRVGAKVSGLPMLLLMTKGRRTGTGRTTPLVYMRDGDDFILIASNAGNHWQPAWFWNVQAHPDVVVQVGAERLALSARVVSAAERERLWPAVVALWPGYERYQHGTARTIPLVTLQRPR